MFRQRQEVARDDLDDLGPVLGLPVLDYVLRDIVPVLVRYQQGGALMELLQDGRLVVRLAVLQDPLDHPATIRVGGQDVDLASEGINDELYVLGGDPLNGFLDNVIAVLILDALEDVCLQLPNQFCLLVREDVLEGLAVSGIHNVGRRPTFCTTLHPYICIDNSIT